MPRIRSLSRSLSTLKQLDMWGNFMIKVFCAYMRENMEARNVDFDGVFGPAGNVRLPESDFLGIVVSHDMFEIPDGFSDMTEAMKTAVLMPQVAEWVASAVDQRELDNILFEELAKAMKVDVPGHPAPFDEENLVEFGDYGRVFFPAEVYLAIADVLAAPSIAASKSADLLALQDAVYPYVLEWIADRFASGALDAPRNDWARFDVSDAEASALTAAHDRVSTVADRVRQMAATQILDARMGSVGMNEDGAGECSEGCFTLM